MKRVLSIVACLLVIAVAAWSQESADTQPAQNSNGSQETITVPKSEFDALKAKIDEMEREIQALKGQPSPSAQPASTPAPEQTAPIEEAGTAPQPEAQPAEVPAPAGGKHFLLPDISLVANMKGHASSDRNDDSRNRIRLSEAEIGIQGYVFPQVKADAFFTTSPEENSPMGVEEAYLTYIGALKGLNIQVGKKHVPFGRTNILHNHSWLYVNAPLVIQNLVTPELSGEGINASYVIPTKSNFFAQMDLGAWSAGDESGQQDLPNVMVGPGANLSNKFSTGRLWTSYPVTANSELELGGSAMQGRSNADPITGVDHVTLTGVDLSYRQFGEGNKRFLLRAENFWRRGSADSDNAQATGYYILANYRSTKDSSVGLLWDWSEFPQAVAYHESALSVIFTRQFSEQYYMRLQLTHGSRPDDDNYNEAWLQWVWGVGPHTHNLE